MKALYTPAAARELEAFHTRQQEFLENLIAQRKHIPGDDEMEITASDIKNASATIRLHGIDLVRSHATELITRAYIALGMLMMVGAVVYPQLTHMSSADKVPAMLFFTGALTVAIGWLLMYWIQIRRRRAAADVMVQIAAERNHHPSCASAQPLSL